MKEFIKNQKGFTGVDVAVSIVLLFIFVTVISTIFLNIYLSYTDSQRNTVAMAYASQIAELVDKLYYVDISDSSNSKLITEIRNIVTNTLYVPTVTVSEITSGQQEIPSMVKNVDIQVSYKIGNTTKSVGINKTKVKEVLVTPNKPKISSDLVPVKFVYTDYMAGLGYWQIASDKDNTWYSYDNKIWAAAMKVSDNLIADGSIEVTSNNKDTLVGKKITTGGDVLLWVPRYAYNATNKDVIFIYSTSDKVVNSSGNLDPMGTEYVINTVFHSSSGVNEVNITGFWIEQDNISTGTISENSTTEEDVAGILRQSKYGK